MNTHRFPAHLTLIAGGFAPRPLPLREPRRNRRTARNGDVARVLNRKELFETVERIGELAPNAPLSFLVVTIDGLGDLGADESQLLMRLVAGRIRSVARATDAVGRMGAATFGAVLQGTGVTAASAVAARLSYHLTQVVRGVDSGLGVRVSAATGTGLNWDTLPVAATAWLPDCG